LPWPWVRGALLGYVLVVIIVAFNLSGDHSVGDWVSTLTVGALVVGGVPGALFGVLVGAGLRRREAAGHTVREIADRVHREAAEHPDDLWARMYSECEAAVRRAGDAVALAPPCAATTWLAELHERMTQELAKAATVAKLGRLAFPDARRVPTEAARNHSAYQQLAAAGADFTAASTRITDIVAKLVRQPHLDQVSEDLRMLENELPSLAEPDLS
jgi:hypothetical protein